MGGGNFRTALAGEDAEGLSPRGRGKRLRPRLHDVRSRSIPAWAGETKRPPTCGVTKTVYPRVGGGNLDEADASTKQRGLSPRGRGKQPPPFEEVVVYGSIPAWAGETTSRSQCGWKQAVYPRVGGGNVPLILRMPPLLGLSPRGRGKHRVGYRCLRPRRSIPAWAGETLSHPSFWAREAVYPRVGGGNITAAQAVGYYGGLSPRGRGKRSFQICIEVVNRSIPAWAGETRVAVNP